jgi:hypothetical protein
MMLSDPAHAAKSSSFASATLSQEERDASDLAESGSHLDLSPLGVS